MSLSPEEYAAIQRQMEEDRNRAEIHRQMLLQGMAETEAANERKIAEETARVYAETKRKRLEEEAFYEANNKRALEEAAAIQRDLEEGRRRAEDYIKLLPQLMAESAADTRRQEAEEAAPIYAETKRKRLAEDAFYQANLDRHLEKVAAEKAARADPYGTLLRQMQAIQGQTDVYKRRSPLSAETHMENIARSLSQDYGITSLADIGVREIPYSEMVPITISTGESEYIAGYENVSRVYKEYFNNNNPSILIPEYKFASEGRGDGYSNYNLQPVQQADGSTIVVPVQHYSKSGLGAFVEDFGPALSFASGILAFAGVPPLALAAGNVALQAGAGNIENIGDALEVAAPYLIPAAVKELAAGADLVGSDFATSGAATLPADVAAGLSSSAVGQAVSNLTNQAVTGLAADVAGSAAVSGITAAIYDKDPLKFAALGGVSALASAAGKSVFDATGNRAYANAVNSSINALAETGDIERAIISGGAAGVTTLVNQTVANTTKNPVLGQAAQLGAMSAITGQPVSTGDLIGLGKQFIDYQQKNPSSEIPLGNQQVSDEESITVAEPKTTDDNNITTGNVKYTDANTTIGPNISGTGDSGIADILASNIEAQRNLSPEAQSIIDQITLAAGGDPEAFAPALVPLLTPGGAAVAGAAAAETAVLLARLAQTPAGQNAIRQAAAVNQNVMSALGTLGAMIGVAPTAFLAGDPLPLAKVQNIATNGAPANFGTYDPGVGGYNTTKANPATKITTTIRPAVDTTSPYPETAGARYPNTGTTTPTTNPYGAEESTVPVTADVINVAGRLGITVEEAAELAQKSPSLFSQVSGRTGTRDFTPDELDTMRTTDLVAMGIVRGAGNVNSPEAVGQDFNVIISGNQPTTKPAVVDSTPNLTIRGDDVINGAEGDPIYTQLADATASQVANQTFFDNSVAAKIQGGASPFDATKSVLSSMGIPASDVNLTALSQALGGQQNAVDALTIPAGGTKATSGATTGTNLTTASVTDTVSTDSAATNAANAVKSGVDSAAATNAAVTTAVNNGASTNAAVDGAVTGAVKAGGDTNAAVNGAVNGATSVGAGTNTATAVANDAATKAGTSLILSNVNQAPSNTGSLILSNDNKNKTDTGNKLTTTDSNLVPSKTGTSLILSDNQYVNNTADKSSSNTDLTIAEKVAYSAQKNKDIQALIDRQLADQQIADKVAYSAQKNKDIQALIDRQLAAQQAAATGVNTSTVGTNPNIGTNLNTNVNTNPNVSTKLILDLSDTTKPPAGGTTVTTNPPATGPTTTPPTGTTPPGTPATNPELELLKAQIDAQNKAIAEEAAQRKASEDQAQTNASMQRAMQFVNPPSKPSSNNEIPAITAAIIGGKSGFVSPLEAFSRMVQSNQYVPQQQQPEGALMQASPYAYGKQTDLNDIFGVGDQDDEQVEQTAKAGGLMTPLMAAGGTTRYGKFASGGLNVVHHAGKMRVDFRRGDAVTGAGDGQSDDIPAMLADGEFVIPADVVAALGNGSTKAGSDALYEMMHSIRARARKGHPKSLPPPAKSPLDYISKRK